MLNAQQRFLDLFKREILKLDLADLDFGIYRILKYRRKQIEDYLDNTIPQKLKEVISSAADTQRAAKEAELAELKNTLNENAVSLRLRSAFDEHGELIELMKSFPLGQQYLELNTELLRLKTVQRLEGTEETAIYNTLYNFFSRYYSDGDFLPVMRRGENVFYAPYNGQDVSFHWQGRGSHYVKTAEELRTYSYREQGWHITFQVEIADTERDQTKGDNRYFFPTPSKAKTNLAKKEYVIPFEFRPMKPAEVKTFGKKKANNGDNDGSEDGAVEETAIVINGASVQDSIINTLLDKIDLLPDLTKTKLLEHAHRFSKKHRYDYFVHPQLKKFLSGELKHYLFNDYLHPDQITSPEETLSRFNKFRAIREVAGSLIDLLDQVESFQAILFEKNKFVYDTRYIVRLDLLGEAFYPAILANQSQLERWRELFALETIDEAFLKTHPTLTVDTQYFDQAFTYRVLAHFENLDEVIDGVLVNGENYAALRSLEPRYAGKITCIYIDPPYNTGGDGFLYKDEFSRHSTWLTMMEYRLVLARQYLSNEGAIFTSIDDNEHNHLKTLQDLVFGNDNFVSNIIWQKKYAPQNDAKWLSDNHDFITCYARNKESWRPVQLPRREEQIAAYKNPDNDSRGVWKAGDLSVKTYSASSDYPITTPSGRVVNPPRGYCWRVSRQRFAEMVTDNRIWFGSDGNNVPAIKRFLTEVKEGVTPMTIWTYQEVGHNQEGMQQLKNLINDTNTLLGVTPKPTRLLSRVINLGTETDSLVLDFFAGSGTTGQAAIELNREDDGQRKFIMVEINEYFNNVLLPRLQKIIYCPEWKDGKPQNYPALILDDAMLPEWVGRSPRVLKILNLESYEDSLDAIEIPDKLTPSAEAHRQLNLSEEYLVKYMLGNETSESDVFLSLDKLEKPFDYKLNIQTPDGANEKKVDLIETFNLLMGFEVKKILRLERSEPGGSRQYILVEAALKGEANLVIWRDVDATLDLNTEKEFLEQHLTLSDFQKLYANAALPTFIRCDILDVEFKRRMLSRDFEGLGV